MAQAKSERMRVVMFPWLAHDHINPYLELAKRLIASASDDHHLDVVVHIVSMPVHLAPLVHQQTDRTRLVELHLPALPDLPPALHTTKGLHARLMPVLKRACDLAAPCFCALLDELSSEAEAGGVSAFHFATCGATAAACFIHCVKTNRPPSAFPFESISLCGVNEDAKYTTLVAVREDITTLVAERDRLPLSLVVTERDRLPLSLERSSGFMSEHQMAQIARGLELSGVARVPRALLAPCVTCAVCSLQAKRGW